MFIQSFFCVFLWLSRSEFKVTLKFCKHFTDLILNNIFIISYNSIATTLSGPLEKQCSTFHPCQKSPPIQNHKQPYILHFHIFLKPKTKSYFVMSLSVSTVNIFLEKKNSDLNQIRQLLLVCINIENIPQLLLLMANLSTVVN